MWVKKYNYYTTNCRFFVVKKYNTAVAEINIKKYFIIKRYKFGKLILKYVKLGIQKTPYLSIYWYYAEPRGDQMSGNQ